MGTWLNLKAFAQRRKPSIEQKPKQLISYIYIYIAHPAQHQRKQMAKLKKWAEELKRYFSKKENADGRQTHENMLNADTSGKCESIPHVWGTRDGVSGTDWVRAECESWL